MNNKKTSKLSMVDLCEENPSVTSGFLSQRSSNVFPCHGVSLKGVVKTPFMIIRVFFFDISTPPTHHPRPFSYEEMNPVACLHDDVIKWNHFPRYWAFVRGIHRSPVNYPHKGPVTRSFDVFFDLRRNKRLSKQPWGWLFDTPSLSLWRHCNGHLNSANLNTHSTTICKLVDLIPALLQWNCRIPNWVSAKTVHSSSTNHGQTTARFRSFFR